MTTTLRRQPLHSGWTLSVPGDVAPFSIQEIPAEVPGTLIPTLEAAGLVPDPYIDDNEKDLAWTGEADVHYRTSFEWQAGGEENVDLVAQSVDTVAEVRLNGTVVGHTSNEHRSWRFRLDDALCEGANELEVLITSPLQAARAFEAEHGELPYSGNKLPYNAIRKMACNLGWDWGPVLVTSGIPGELTLESWSTARLGRIRPQIDVQPDGRGTVDLDIPVVRSSDAGRALTVRAVLVGTDKLPVADAGVDVPAGSDSIAVHLDVADPALWWPRGYGEQPLHRLAIVLQDAEGQELDRVERRVAFRTAGFVQEDDEYGRSFRAVVNGRPILIKGANWIPEDCFPHRLNRTDIEARIRDAIDAEMNLLRIWGGGLYESEDLYELCDELGVLVWQDFALACAAYSEAEPMRAEIEQEAREQIVRLAWHPSLIHWNGCNENLVGHSSWGWADRIPEGVGWGLHYYEEMFPALLAELDPTRTYSPSSPFSEPGTESAQDPTSGTIHQWGVWNDPVVGDPVHYRDSVPRFAAEFGFQAPAAYATIAGSISERPLDPDSPLMLSHQKAFEGQEKLRRAYRDHLPEPADFRSFLVTTQMMQARALRIGIGHYRSHWPICGGTIMWQLNDCWPVTSWAAVDGEGRRKPLWYALREVHAPVWLSFQPRENTPALCLGNDTDQPLDLALRLVRQRHDGTELASQELALQVSPRGTGTWTLPEELIAPEDPADEILVATTEDGALRTIHTFTADKELALDPEALHAHAERTADDVTVHLTARSTVKDVMVLADAVDPAAVCDRQLVTLLAGEETTLRIRTDAADAQVFLDPEVLFSVNALLGRATER